MHFNFIWVLLEKFGTSLLSVGMFFIYAYLLSPSEMGIAVMILAITQFLSTMISTLFEDAMVQLDKITNKHINTAFCSATILSVICALLTISGFTYFTPHIAHYNTLALTTFASLEIILTNIGLTYVAQLRRDGNFKVLALRVIIGRICGAICGLVAILSGLGAWAIIIQSVIGTALQTIILIAAVRNIPTLTLDIPTLKYYISFGSKLSLKRLQWDIIIKAMPIIAGITSGTAAAGHLGFAWRIVELFRSAIVSGLMNYLLPHFSRIQKSKNRMAQEFISTTSLVVFFSSPIFLGLMVTAPLIITTLFEPKWYPTIPIIQLFCISALLSCYRVTATISMTACGHPEKMLHEGMIVTSISMLTMFLIGHIGPWILPIIFILQIVTLLPISIRIINDLIGMTWKEQLFPTMKYATPSIMMALILYLLQILFPTHPIINMLHFQIPVGITIFTLITLVFYQKEITSWYASLTMKDNP
ncbi:MAG: oligosaccharide flippase family protein [Alphaproteobacteria bacterium]